MSPKLSLAFICLLTAVLPLGVGSQAHAVGESVQITNVSPTGVVSPGTTVNFSTTASGFIVPAYAVTDAFTASGATVGTIDNVGYFTWTPGVYDAGNHAITVTASDAMNHTASSTVHILVASNFVFITNLSPGPIVAVRRPVTFTMTAPGFVTPSYTVYDSSGSTITPANTNSSSGIFTWTPLTDELGTHSLAIIASDPYGHHAETRQVITVVNPVLSIQSLKPGATAGAGSAISFVASSNLTATTTYTVQDSFVGTTTVAASNISAAGLFTWTPTSADLGTHIVTVTATDAYGNAASSTVALAITTAPATVQAPAAANATANAPAAAAGAAKYLFTKNLNIGSQGAAVVELQKRLAALGFFSGPSSGYFGPMTALAVKKFQAARGLARVGNVGPGTRAALNK